MTVVLEQQRFLGSSVRNFNCAIGWGGQETTLSVSLADDVRNGDVFLPPDPGTPVGFRYMDFRFSGLLQRWTMTGDVNGYPTYEATLIDPRVLLDGVQVILSDYIGEVGGIPNLLNVYGALEARGFGTSKLNDTGIPWYLVKEVLSTMLINGVRFHGFNYTVDLSALPTIGDYRLPGPSMSISEIIQDICETTSSDYFVKLENDLTTIRVYLVSRATQPMLGVINQYVSETPNAKLREIGYEMVNDENAKFIIGGKKSTVFYTSSANFSDEIRNTIWPYWGNSFEGTLIIGRGTGDRHTFVLDSRAVLLRGVGNTYPTNIGEMRAALNDQLTWETFLWSHCFNKYYREDDGTESDVYYKLDDDGNFIPGTQSYNHNGFLNPVFKRAYDLGLVGGINSGVLSRFLNADDASVIMNTYSEQISTLVAQGMVRNAEKDPVEKLYDLIKDYASEYYGRKFMVRVDEVEWYRDADTGQVFLSHEPVSDGFVDEDVWLNGISRNLLPVEIDKIITENGRIEAFVRFDNADQLDLTGIPPEDILYGRFYKSSDSRFAGDFHSIFVKCQVDSKYVYLDNNTGLSPRAVITLPQPMFTKIDNTYDSSILADFLNEVWEVKQAQDPNEFTDAKKNQIYVKLKKSYGAVGASFSPVPLFVPPDIAAIPLQSNKYTYGPWYAAGADGRVSIESDDSLVPWNYGGTYTAMNAAAGARFNDISFQQIAEYGRVETPDPPQFDLGYQLLGNGPYLTDLQVSVGDGGVTTVYSFKTWTPRFGKLSRYWADKVTRVSQANQKLRGQMRNMQKNIYLWRNKARK